MNKMKRPSFTIKYELYRLTYLPRASGAVAKVMFQEPLSHGSSVVEKEISFYSSDLQFITEEDALTKNIEWMRELTKRRLSSEKIEVYADGDVWYEVRVSAENLKSEILVKGKVELPKDKLHHLYQKIENQIK
jgi:hypothetical protein